MRASSATSTAMHPTTPPIMAPILLSFLDEAFDTGSPKELGTEFPVDVSLLMIVTVMSEVPTEERTRVFCDGDGYDTAEVLDGGDELDDVGELLVNETGDEVGDGDDTDVAGVVDDGLDGAGTLEVRATDVVVTGKDDVLVGFEPVKT